MTFEQVKEGLKQGKKYRRKVWTLSEYIQIWCDKIHLFENEWLHIECGFTLEDFDADDWEEVQG